MLVLVSPSYNETSVNELADRARSLWLAAVSFAIAATIATAYCISRVIQNGVRPLDNAIAVRLRSGDVRADSDKIPNELRPTFGHFVEIMDELDEERRDKQCIIADVSHDLRTLLTVILGYATALLDGKVAKDEEQGCLEAIAKKAKVASGMTETLFEYAKTEHPDFEVCNRPVDVCELTRLCVIGRQDDAEFFGCQIDVEIPDAPIIALADERLLTKAADNLIDNALKHNPRGTVVRVVCSRTRQSARLSVSNTGNSIPEDIRETIFEPCVTGDGARNPEHGSGLGLAIARRYVELQGGPSVSWTNPLLRSKSRSALSSPWPQVMPNLREPLGRA